ncbi:hypothetical protein BDZ89DRAFT_1057240 [Hymenopellis radicata]|nr:hypothetical protein BDZ89DRAFT_1057240 [Hymenopellis radicata]
MPEHILNSNAFPVADVSHERSASDASITSASALLEEVENWLAHVGQNIEALENRRRRWSWSSNLSQESTHLNATKASTS